MESKDKVKCRDCRFCSNIRLNTGVTSKREPYINNCDHHENTYVNDWFTDMEKECKEFKPKEPETVRCRDCKHCSNIKESEFGAYDVNKCAYHTWKYKTDDLRECNRFEAKDTPTIERHCKNCRWEDTVNNNHKLCMNNPNSPNYGTWNETTSACNHKNNYKLYASRSCGFCVHFVVPKNWKNGKCNKYDGKWYGYCFEPDYVRGCEHFQNRVEPIQEELPEKCKNCDFMDFKANWESCKRLRLQAKCCGTCKHYNGRCLQEDGIECYDNETWRSWESRDPKIEGTCRECENYVDITPIKHSNEHCKIGNFVYSKDHWKDTWREHHIKDGFKDCRKFKRGALTSEKNDGLDAMGMVYDELKKKEKKERIEEALNPPHIKEKKKEVSKMEDINKQKEDLKKQIKERKDMIEKVYEKRIELIKKVECLGSKIFHRQYFKSSWYYPTFYKLNKDFIQFVKDKKLKKLILQEYRRSGLNYKKDNKFYKDNKLWNEAKPLLQKILDNYEAYELDQLTTELCEATDCYKALAGVKNVCSECGEEHGKKDAFCSQCGHRIGGVGEE